MAQTVMPLKWRKLDRHKAELSSETGRGPGFDPGTSQSRTLRPYEAT